MIKKTSVKNLHKNLWHRGPYVYYYDGHGFEGNPEIIQTISNISSKYQNLIVYEADWYDQIKLYPSTSIKWINNVYLYFKGDCKLKLSNPNYKQIKDLFIEAVKYFNINCDITAQNIGSKMKLIEPKNMENEKKLQKYLNTINIKRKNILKRKIILSNEINEGKIYQNDVKHISTSFEDNKKHDCIYCIKNSPITIKNLTHISNSTQVSNPWFYDAKLSDLPKNIFIEQPDKNDNLENSKQKYFDKSTDFDTRIYNTSKLYISVPSNYRDISKTPVQRRISGNLYFKNLIKRRETTKLYSRNEFFDSSNKINSKINNKIINKETNIDDLLNFVKVNLPQNPVIKNLKNVN